MAKRLETESPLGAATWCRRVNGIHQLTEEFPGAVPGPSATPFSPGAAPQRSVQPLLGAESLTRPGGDGDDPCPALKELAVQLGETRKCLFQPRVSCVPSCWEGAEEVGRGVGVREGFLEEVISTDI